MSEAKAIRKAIRGRKLLEVYSELTKPNVRVLRQHLKVLPNGEVEVVECVYEELQQSS